MVGRACTTLPTALARTGCRHMPGAAIAAKSDTRAERKPASMTARQSLRVDWVWWWKHVMACRFSSGGIGVRSLRGRRRAMTVTEQFKANPILERSTLATNLKVSRINDDTEGIRTPAGRAQWISSPSLTARTQCL